MKELTLSCNEDLSCVGLEGDYVDQEHLKKLLQKLQCWYPALVQDQDFHKDEDGLQWYYFSHYEKRSQG